MFTNNLMDAKKDYVFNWRDTYHGTRDKTTVSANSIGEAIKKFGDLVALGGVGTANAYVVSVSPNDGWVSLYGKVSDLLKIKFNDSFSVEDERLSPMTYVKLKEMGYTSENWKGWSQEKANKIVASGRKEENKKQSSTEEHSERSSKEGRNEKSPSTGTQNKTHTSDRSGKNKQLSEQLSGKGIDKETLLDLYNKVDKNDIIIQKYGKFSYKYIPTYNNKYKVYEVGTDGSLVNLGETANIEQIANLQWNRTHRFSSRCDVTVVTREDDFSIPKKQTEKLRKYAKEYGYDYEQVVEAVKTNYVHEKMSVSESIDDVMELIEEGEDLDYIIDKGRTVTDSDSDVDYEMELEKDGKKEMREEATRTVEDGSLVNLSASDRAKVESCFKSNGYRIENSGVTWTGRVHYILKPTRKMSVPEMQRTVDKIWEFIERLGYPTTFSANEESAVFDIDKKYVADSKTFKVTDKKSGRSFVVNASDSLSAVKMVSKLDSVGSDLDKYQEWVDYDMKRYGKISEQTMREIKEAGLKVVKDKYGDYEVIA